MKHPIDLEHWNRKEHFLFFGSMDDPFFGLTTQIDVTSIYKRRKRIMPLFSSTPYIRL